MWWNLANTVIGLIAVVIALVALRLTFRQDRLLKIERQEHAQRVTEDNEWAHKFTEAIRSLSIIIPRHVPGPREAYDVVFTDIELRQRIEAHLINLERGFTGMTMQTRTLDVSQTRLQVVRKTIQDVLDVVEKLKVDDPALCHQWNIKVKSRVSKDVPTQ